MVECAHLAPYRWAVRVKDGVVTFRKLGTARNRNVVATWCDRCGVLIDDQGVRHYPRARVIEDLL
jgi:hypothetical protein